MKLRFFLATILSLPCLALVGCGNSSTPKAEVSTEPLSDADIALLGFGNQNVGRQIVVVVQEHMRLHAQFLTFRRHRPQRLFIPRHQNQIMPSLRK